MVLVPLSNLMCPDGLAFLDRGDVADLHAHVAGGMLAAHGVDDCVLHLVERAAVPDGLVHGEMDAAFGEEGKGVHGGLDVGEPVSEREFGVGGKRSGAEGRNENGFRLQGGIRHDAVRTLDQRTPKAGFQQEIPGVVGGDGGLRAKVDILLGVIDLDEDGEQLALLSADDLRHGAADRRGDEDGGILLVGENGGTGEDAVAFLHEEPREEALEVGRLHGYDARFYRLDDFLGGGTLHGDVEALFQIELV